MCCLGRERTLRVSISGVLVACAFWFLTDGRQELDRVESRADLPSSSFHSMAEMILGYPLFRGRDNNDQLTQIMRIVGTPDEKTLRKINVDSVS